MPLDTKTPRLRKSDLLWALGYPLYQTAGTLRHEASHAFGALLSGGTIQEFVFWPTRSVRGSIRWGYVRWDGGQTWFSIAAPYLCDLLTFLLGYWLVQHDRIKPRWLWLNLVILSLISPLVNSLYNYQGGLRYGINDVGWLLTQLPPTVVHGYFVVTLALYVAGISVTVWGKHKTLAGC